MFGLEECSALPLVTQPSPQISLLIDNQGAIKFAKHDANGTQTKHIDIEYHVVRDLVFKKKMCLEFCASVQMIANIFTKPIGTQLFSKFINSICVKAISGYIQSEF